MSQSQLNSNATDARSVGASRNPSEARWQPLHPQSPIAEKAIIMNQRQREKLVSEAVRSGVLPHQIRQQNIFSQQRPKRVGELQLRNMDSLMDIQRIPIGRQVTTKQGARRRTTIVSRGDNQDVGMLVNMKEGQKPFRVATLNQHSPQGERPSPTRNQGIQGLNADFAHAGITTSLVGRRPNAPEHIISEYNSSVRNETEYDMPQKSVVYDNRAQLLQRFLELKRFVFQMQNIVKFSKDEAADVQTLLTMVEAALKRRVYLNMVDVNLQLMRNVIQHVWEKLGTNVDVKFIQEWDEMKMNVERMRTIVEDPLVAGIQLSIKGWMRSWFATEAHLIQRQEADHIKVQSGPPLEHVDPTQPPSADKNSGENNMHTLEGSETAALPPQASIKILNAAINGNQVHQSSEVKIDDQGKEIAKAVSTVMLNREMSGGARGERKESAQQATDSHGGTDKIKSSDHRRKEPVFLLTDIDADEGDQPSRQSSQMNSKNELSISAILRHQQQIGQTNTTSFHSSDMAKYASFAKKGAGPGGGMPPVIAESGETRGGSPSPTPAPMATGRSFDNEIIMRVEMKKFFNLVNKGERHRNNLIQNDNYRVFPLNQIKNGNARAVMPPVCLDESDSFLKWHPKLFALQEKLNKSKLQARAQNPRQSYDARPSLYKLLMKSKHPRQSADSSPDGATHGGKASDAAPTEDQLLTPQPWNASQVTTPANRMNLKTSIAQRVATRKLSQPPGVMNRHVKTPNSPTAFHLTSDSQIAHPRGSIKGGVLVSDSNSHCHDRTVSRVAKLRQRAEMTQNPISEYECGAAEFSQAPNDDTRPKQQSRNWKSRGAARTNGAQPASWKNKYGLNVRSTMGPAAGARTSANASIYDMSRMGGSKSTQSPQSAAGARRVPLEERYNIRPGDWARDKPTSRYNMSMSQANTSRQDRAQISAAHDHMVSNMSKMLTMSEGQPPQNPQEIELDYNVWGEIEPYGWKIGIKGEGQSFKKEALERKQRRVRAMKRNQRRHGRDIKRVLHDHAANEQYRQMYETYVAAQQVRANMGQEFARILDEDCEIGADFVDPETQPWKTSAMIRSEADHLESQRQAA